MSKVKNELAARAEVAMMGFTVPVRSDEEVQFLTQYIIGAVKSDTHPLYNIDPMERVRQYTKTNEVTHITTKRVYGMQCIVYCIKNDDPEEGIAPPFSTDYGTGYPAAFTYVLNLDSDDMCSEFGDSFFVKHGDTYKNVTI